MNAHAAPRAPHDRELLALQNAELLRLIDQPADPEAWDGLEVMTIAVALNRDPSNLRKSIAKLEREGLVVAKPLALTDLGRRILPGLDVLQGRALAASVLTHGQLRPDPNNPRKTFDQAELEALAESIATRGLMQGLQVKIRADGEAVIVAGERRWRAIGLLISREDPRWPADRPVPHLVSHVEGQDEILVDALIENMQRVDLHPLDEAEAFARLKAAGWSASRIAEALGNRTKRYVEQRLDLLNLNEAQRRRMRLDPEDLDYLSPTGARNMLQHLRQIASGASEQRDIEEIAPTSAPPLATDDPLVVNGVRYPNLTRANEARRITEGGGPVNSGGSQAKSRTEPTLSPRAQLVLVEMDHAIALHPGRQATPGDPSGPIWVPAPRYWLDGAVSELSRAGLLTSQHKLSGGPHLALTEAGEDWIISVGGIPGFTDAERTEYRLAAGLPAYPAATYSTPWLNAEEPPAEPVAALAVPPSAEFDEDQAEQIRHAEETLQKVSEALKTGLFGSQGELAFRDLLVAVGLDGPLKIQSGDNAGGIFVGEDEIATVDPQRELPDALALARAELIAFAVNAFAGYSKDAHL